MTHMPDRRRFLGLTACSLATAGLAPLLGTGPAHAQLPPALPGMGDPDAVAFPVRRIQQDKLIDVEDGLLIRRAHPCAVGDRNPHLTAQIAHGQRLDVQRPSRVIARDQDARSRGPATGERRGESCHEVARLQILHQSRIDR